MTDHSVVFSSDEFLEWYADICEVCKKHNLYFVGVDCGNGVEAKLGERFFDDVIIDFDGVWATVFLDPLNNRYYVLTHSKEVVNEWRSI